MSARPSFRPTLIQVILAVAILLRLVGVAVNGEANDPHMPVIQVIAFEHRIPADAELWEAFQPKLYHLTVAEILRVRPDLSVAAQFRIAQAVSCLAGVLTLLVLLALLRDLPVSLRAQQITFALVALNPKMIATSIQATNDAFVIFFVTVALAAGYRFFRSFGRSAFVVMTAGVLLAGISKGNGLVVAIAITLTFVAAVIRPAVSRRQLFGYAAVFLLAFAAFVPQLGGYWSRYQERGSPFAINQDPVPPPHFIQETYENRPGITSVVDGFFTFHFIDLLIHPRITEGVVYPRHRTSMWSLFYGGMNSVHYDSWPVSWMSGSRVVNWLLRLIMLLALLPTAVLVAGTVRSMFRVVKEFAARTPRAGWSAEVLMAVTTAGYIAFVMYYGYRYRDFANMKPIFLYPAAVPLMVYCAREFDRVSSFGRRWIPAVAYGSAALLCVAYVADVSILLAHLASM